MDDIVKLFLSILSRVAELERKDDNRVAKGTVHEVDAKAGTVRLKIGESDDGQPFLTPPIPYSQTMGAMKFHMPPSVGQQMTAFNDAGDFRQGIAFPMTQSDANKSPSEKGDEGVGTFGKWRFELREAQMKISIGDLVLDATDAGFKCSIGSSTLELSQEGIKANGKLIDLSGDRLTHNDKEIGSTHKHLNVMPGPGVSGYPE